MNTRIDGSVLAVLAAYQNNLVSSGSEDVTSGSMSWPPKSGKVDLCSERVNLHNLTLL